MIIKAHKQQRSTAIIGFDCRDDQRLIDLQSGFPGDIETPLHMTLLFLGDTDQFDKQQVCHKLVEFSKTYAPIDGIFNGLAAFNGDTNGKYPIVLLFDSPALPGFRQALRDIFPLVEQMHGFVPHVTLGYTAERVETPDIKSINIEKKFDFITLFWGNDVSTLQLTGNQVIKQLPIDEASMGRLKAVRLNIFNDEVNALAEKMYNGELTIGAWEESMKQQLRELASSMTAMDKGGWQNVTFADWGRLGNPMKFQYNKLHEFAQKVAADKDTISLQAIQARARMYAGGAEAGANVVMVGTDFKDHLPWIPKDGSTECLVNCKCAWVLTVIDIIGNYKLVQAVWTLSPAEHCDDCLDREGHTEVFRVNKNVDVPDVIGYSQ